MARLEINSDALIDPVLLDFSRMCRLCLQQTSELSPLFPETEPTDVAVACLPSKIRACVSIEVLPEHNNMPKHVCSKCVQQIDNWVKFKELCESANNLLQQCLANLQPSSNDEAVTLQNNLHGPDTILSDMDVSIFERDSLFGTLEEGSMPLSEDFHISFSDNELNQKLQSIKRTILGNSSTPKRINENCDYDNQTCRNILSNKNKSCNSEGDKEEPDLPKGNSKWKLKYNRCYRNCYPCDICNKEFTKFTSLINHDRVEHYDLLNDFCCDVCGALFVSQSRIEIHKLKHRQKTFECLECKKMFVSKKSLSIHMRLHDPDNKFKCKFCNVARSSQRMLDDHIRCVHSKELLFRCDLCGREFATKQSRELHYKRHINKKTFKCNSCGKSFICSNSYKAHVESHKTVKDIVCSVCGKSFKTNETVNQHMRTHGEKIFKCLVCSLSFSQRYLLVRHEATHLNLFPFKCTFCLKSFKRKDILNMHMRRHTDDKRYSCQYCSNSFFTVGSLRNHKCTVTLIETDDLESSLKNCVNNTTDKSIVGDS